MEQLSEKQKDFYNTINLFIQKNKYLPTIGEVKKILNYKSYNTIYQYITLLTKKNYLKYDKETKRISIKDSSYLNDNICIIPYINIDSHIKIDSTLLDINNNYFAFIINNNNLNSFYIKYKDTIILTKNLDRLNNKLVLVHNDNKYQVYKYEKRNGFHHLFNDKENIVLENTLSILGKVVLLIRNNLN